MIVDSHCHLDTLDSSGEPDGVQSFIDRAIENDVGYLLNVCIDIEHFQDVLNVAKQFPNVSASVGLHPNEKDGKEPTVEELVLLGQDEKVVAVGETGLDYYRTEGDVAWQQERFRTHIRAAHKLKKPIIIHSRMAPDDTINIMKEERAEEVGGVMHCFTETMDMAKAAMNLGFFISISGIVTFKKAENVQQVAREVPLDRLLIETDSPYLAPVPYRGKPNEPAYVRYVAEEIARLRNVDYSVVAEHTTANFFRCFPSVKK